MHTNRNKTVRVEVMPAMKKEIYAVHKFIGLSKKERAVRL